MKKSVILICIISFVIQIGCGPKTGRTAKGYEYTIVSENEKGQKVNPGDDVNFNIAFYLNDTLKDARPLDQNVPTDIGKQPYPPFIELLSLLKVGDSAFVIVKLDTMSNLSPQYKKTDIVKYAVKVNSITDKAVVEKRNAELAQKKAAMQELSAGLVKQKPELLAKLQATAKEVSAGTFKPTRSSPTGIQYLLLEPGNGPVHKATEDAFVHYIGCTKDGKEFDSSLNRGEPLPVKVGTGGVIKGWDEALMTLPAGSRAIIVIPSALAYGKQGAGNGAIPPDSDLLFYIHILN